jgi:hypothetical protein
MSNTEQIPKTMTDFNRLEVINHCTGDPPGREYVLWTKKKFVITTDIQDDGRTLKLFITGPEPEHTKNTEENRERLAQKAYDHMDEGSIRGEVVDRIEKDYKENDDIFESDWADLIGDE